MRTHLSINRKPMIIFAWLMLLVVGCSTQVENNVTNTVVATLDSTIPSLTPSQTTIPTSTRTQVLLETSTITPVPTSTAEPTNTPTWTPVSKFPPEESLAAILEIYTDNGNCALPCWWGITPGETPWEEARERLAPLGDMVATDLNKNGVRYDFQFVVPEDIDSLGYFWPALIVEDSIVVAINISSQWIMRDFDYSLAGILHHLGRPDEIWLNISPESMGSPHYDMSLFYSKKGIEVGIVGNASKDGAAITICPQQIYSLSKFPPGILLWSIDKNISFKEINSSVLADLTEINTRKFYLLESLTTDIDTDTFYEIYLDPMIADCFDVPLDSLP